MATTMGFNSSNIYIRTSGVFCYRVKQCSALMEFRCNLKLCRLTHNYYKLQVDISLKLVSYSIYSNHSSSILHNTMENRFSFYSV